MAAYWREEGEQREIMVGYKRYHFVNVKSAVALKIRIAGKIYNDVNELIEKAKQAIVNA